MTTTVKFFFDTADIAYINGAWSKLKESGHFVGADVVGITTNPNALAKVGCKTMEAFDDLVKRLCETVSAIREDNQGVVYVQLPSSKASKDQVFKFAEHVAGLTDGKTKVGMKIPPYPEVLKLVPELQKILDVNVTGIADGATAVKCITHGVNWVSIIPGRMEEAGIDAKRQIRFINDSNKGKTQVIAGSMRTLDGLSWVIEEGTVPTIGTRVFDQILAQNSAIERFRKMWNTQDGSEPFSPPVTETMTKLSTSFFEEMDKLGVDLYQDFLASLPN